MPLYNVNEFSIANYVIARAKNLYNVQQLCAIIAILEGFSLKEYNQHLCSYTSYFKRSNTSVYLLSIMQETKTDVTPISTRDFIKYAGFKDNKFVVEYYPKLPDHKLDSVMNKINTMPSLIASISRPYFKTKDHVSTDFLNEMPQLKDQDLINLYENFNDKEDNHVY